MRNDLLVRGLLAVAIAVVPGAIGWRLTEATVGRAQEPARSTRVERGAYLVSAMVCNDCHTPWKIGPKGPEPDMTRALSGHPADVVMPPPPKLPAGPWTWMGAATNTAFAGPWGVSFSANLTPDPDTGLGKWTEDMFIAAIRTGRHEGKGRPILPPMPYPMFRNLNDEDLASIFAYLQSLKPTRNRVPSPIDPPETQQ
jgi:hypothetical protein